MYYFGNNNKHSCFSAFKNFVFKTYIKTIHFFQNIYKNIIYPAPKPFYEFIVNKIYLITPKDYSNNKENVTKRFILDAEKLHHEFNIEKT